VAVAAAIVAASGGAGPAPGGGPAQAAVTRPDPTPAQIAGQRVVVGFAGTTPPPSLVRRIRRGETGAVIIMGPNVAGRAALARLTRRLQAIPRPASVDEPLLIMVDQEGGQVRRIPGPPARSAAVMGAGDPVSTRAAGVATGRLLSRTGVGADLAPVADVAGAGSALSRHERTFGSSPAAVARHAVAFADGLRAGGAIATAKHFPGLGRTRVNTDDAPVTIHRSAALLRRVDARPFAALIAHGVPMVMISAAVYPGFDPGTPALLSRRVVVGELRTRLGFDGTVITDALDTPALAAVGSDAVVAVRAAAAGNDLLIYIDMGRGIRAARALRSALDSGRLRADAARASVDRVLALRAGLRA
jgi:beta-N-acetylhexosaminidase